MKALFIGGTGTISTDVVELAQQRGWEITLLNRGSKKLPEGVGSITADIHDEEAVAKAIADESYDVVAQFIAYTAEDVAVSYTHLDVYKRQLPRCTTVSAKRNGILSAVWICLLSTKSVWYLSLIHI